MKKFDVMRYADIDPSQFKEALEYIQNFNIVDRSWCIEALHNNYRNQEFPNNKLVHAYERYFGIIYFDELEQILNFKEELKDVLVNDEEIDLSRMSSAYILLPLSYIRVNMNRNPDKPLCCYRLYQKITENIYHGL